MLNEIVIAGSKVRDKGNASCAALETKQGFVTVTVLFTHKTTYRPQVEMSGYPNGASFLLYSAISAFRSPGHTRITKPLSKK